MQKEIILSHGGGGYVLFCLSVVEGLFITGNKITNAAMRAERMSLCLGALACGSVAPCHRFALGFSCMKA